MKNGNHPIWLFIPLAGLLISAGQLPPEIMADRHMVRLDRLISENRLREAYRLTGEIAEFYEKHSLDLPHEFYFKQARIASSLGLLEEAIAALHAYLNKAGKEGARYVDALKLLDRTEEGLREAEAEQKRIEAERRRAEAERTRIEVERRRVEAARKQHPDLENRQVQAASVRLARDPMRSEGLGPEMVTVAKGAYQYAHSDEEPVKKFMWVEFDRPFAISKYEATRGEFRRFVEATGYRTEAEQEGGRCRQGAYDGDDEIKNASWKRLRWHQTDTHPVVCVSLRDAMAYAEWLSRETGRGYRLPTVFEWQYAARAGSEFAMLDLGHGPMGGHTHNHCGRANLEEDSRTGLRPCVDGVEHTAEVGSFPPNAIGLHDMIGNVGEWVSTCDIGYITPELLLQDEKVRELLLHYESDHHCEARKQVAAGYGYDGGVSPSTIIYSISDTPLWSSDKDVISIDYVGFRLVKDFELRPDPREKTADVAE